MSEPQFQFRFPPGRWRDTQADGSFSVDPKDTEYSDLGLVDGRIYLQVRVKKFIPGYYGLKNSYDKHTRLVWADTEGQLSGGLRDWQHYEVDKAED